MIRVYPVEARQLYEQTVEVAVEKLRQLIEKYPGFYPMYTHQGKWKHDLPAWTHWCDGFLPGMMWILATTPQIPEKEARWWQEQAIRYSKPLEPRKEDRDVHDLGFIFMSTYYRWYRLTGDAALNDVLIQAGRTLALRFQPKGKYLCSFIGPQSLFIDIMMNVGIIYYAAQQTGDQKLRSIADAHTQTTRRYLVRGDGSTAHEGVFDLDTGEFLRQSTHQGYRGDSCWSRGLTWALYGFTTCYQYTRNPQYLATAQACADYYLEHVPEDGIPPWDFDAPDDLRGLVDTSAAAIAASGLLELAREVPDPAKGLLYRQSAHYLLVNLCQKYVAKDDPAWEGILKGGVYHYHKKLGVNESVMWGEYFFLEALQKVLTHNDEGSATQ